MIIIRIVLFLQHKEFYISHTYMSFKTLLTHYRTIIDTELQTSLPTYFQRYDHQTPRTSKTCDFVTQGGKRIRPVLAMMYAKEL